MVKFRKYIWRVWASAIGVKAKADDNRFSDHVAIMRTVILFLIITTNVVIIVGNIHRW